MTKTTRTEQGAGTTPVGAAETERRIREELSLAQVGLSKGLGPDTTILRVNAAHAPQGGLGQLQLATGKDVGLRLWREQPGADAPASRRDYEIVGYVVAGRARLVLEEHYFDLRPGDSWLVPRGTLHRYLIQEPFVALEATSPPACRCGGQEEPELKGSSGSCAGPEAAGSRTWRP